MSVSGTRYFLGSKAFVFAVRVEPIGAGKFTEPGDTPQTGATRLAAAGEVERGVASGSGLSPVTQALPCAHPPRGWGRVRGPCSGWSSASSASRQTGTPGDRLWLT